LTDSTSPDPDTKIFEGILEGWGADNGWPTRKTLEVLDMKKVADTMAGKGKLRA
jgi:hypothetical protein